MQTAFFCKNYRKKGVGIDELGFFGAYLKRVEHLLDAEQMESRTHFDHVNHGLRR